MEMRGLELRQLRYFVVVAEELNWQRAGARLNICAPPLLMQMRKLQDFLEVKLLKTHRRRLQLTPEGMLFLAEARTLLADAQRAVARVRDAAGGQLGQLRIGCTPVAELGVLPAILARFRPARPNIQIRLHSLSPSEQLKALDQRKLDIGFSRPPSSDGEYEWMEIGKQPFVVAIHRDHPLYMVPASTVAFEDLSGIPLIVSRTYDPIAFAEIEAAFKHASSSMEVAYEVDNPLAMIALVDSGLGCCLVPQQYTGKNLPANVVYKPLAQQMEDTLAIIKRKDVSGGVTKTFWEFAALSSRTPTDSGRAAVSNLHDYRKAS